MHKFTKAIAAAGIAAGLLASPAAANHSNIVDFAIDVSGPDVGLDNNPADFDILIQGVLATDLAGALSAKGQRTVFAPNDQAFMDFFDVGTEAEALEAAAGLGIETLRAVISYHVAPGARTADEVVPAERIRTITKDFITKDAGSAVLVDGQGNEVNIIGVDNIASNGVVHVIDSVLLPS